MAQGVKAMLSTILTDIQARLLRCTAGRKLQTGSADHRLRTTCCCLRTASSKLLLHQNWGRPRLHSSNYSCYMLRTWTSDAVHKQLAYAVHCSQIAFALEEASAPLEVVGAHADIRTCCTGYTAQLLNNSL